MLQISGYNPGGVRRERGQDRLGRVGRADLPFPAWGTKGSNSLWKVGHEQGTRRCQGDGEELEGPAQPVRAPGTAGCQGGSAATL